ncbi:MAG TPA: hypothetical protein VHG93_09620 [Longimicrobium sp.]|nr:hypothetical protein [Longimicrobium sp.]
MTRDSRLLVCLPLLASGACAADAIAGPQLAPEPEARPAAEVSIAPPLEPAPGIRQPRAIDVVTGGRQPVWIVDGVPSFTHPGLDPADIASVEVLDRAVVSCCFRESCPQLVILIITREGAR